MRKPPRCIRSRDTCSAPLPAARRWQRILSDGAHLPGAGVEMIEEALTALEPLAAWPGLARPPRCIRSRSTCSAPLPGGWARSAGANPERWRAFARRWKGVDRGGADYALA